MKEKLTVKRYIYERRVLKYLFIDSFILIFLLFNYFLLFLYIYIGHCMKMNHGFILALVDKKQKLVLRMLALKMVYFCKYFD